MLLSRNVISNQRNARVFHLRQQMCWAVEHGICQTEKVDYRGALVMCAFLGEVDASSVSLPRYQQEGVVEEAEVQMYGASFLTTICMSFLLFVQQPHDSGLGVIFCTSSSDYSSDDWY
jgi:hypothetical protein